MSTCTWKLLCCGSHIGFQGLVTAGIADSFELSTFIRLGVMQLLQIHDSLVLIKYLTILGILLLLLKSIVSPLLIDHTLLTASTFPLNSSYSCVFESLLWVWICESINSLLKLATPLSVPWQFILTSATLTFLELNSYLYV